jgi:hypothetical protein
MDQREIWALLTLMPLMWRIRWAPNNASKWQFGFNLAFKGLNKASQQSGTSSLQLLSCTTIGRKKEVSAFKKCILLNKGSSFAILLQHIHTSWEKKCWWKFYTKYSTLTESCKCKCLVEKYKITYSVLDRNKIIKLVFIFQEAWFTFTKNVNNQNNGC